MIETASVIRRGTSSKGKNAMGKYRNGFFDGLNKSKYFIDYPLLS